MLASKPGLCLPWLGNGDTCRIVSVCKPMKTQCEEYYERKNRRHEAWQKFWSVVLPIIGWSLFVVCVVTAMLIIGNMLGALIVDHKLIRVQQTALTSQKEAIETLQQQMQNQSNTSNAFRSVMQYQEQRIDDLSARISKLEPQPHPYWYLPTNFSYQDYTNVFMVVTNKVWWTNSAIATVITNDYRWTVRIPPKHPGRQP